MSTPENLAHDVRYGLRMMRRSPGFTAVAVLSLAVGIGANAAIFSVIDALMFKPLPVRDPDTLVMVWTADGPARGQITFDHGMYDRFKEFPAAFSSMTAIWVIDRSNVIVNPPASQGGRAEPDPGQIRVGLVSGDYFQTLGVGATTGRVFTAADDRVPGGHPIAVLSDAFWRRRFAAQDALGRTISLNGTTYDVVGVAPPGFSGDWVGTPTDFWVPYMMSRQVVPEMPDQLRHPARVFARLAPGVSFAQAQAMAATRFQQVLRDELGPNPTAERKLQLANRRLELEPGARGYSPQRNKFAQPLAILTVVVGLVLLTACANIANLLLARATARQREMALRIAVGAERSRIVTQLLTESVLLSTIGGVLGMVFAVWGTSALSASIQSGPVSMAQPGAGLALDLHLDVRNVLFGAALCVTTGVLFGLAPAFRGSRTSLSSALTERGTGQHTSGRRFGIGKILVMSQVAVSLLLLVGAGLFVRTLRNLETKDLGMERQHLLLAWTVPGQTGRQGPALADMWRTIQQRMASLPGVVSASALNGGVLNGAAPSGGREYQPMTVLGEAPKTTTINVARTFVMPGLFTTMGIPLAAGREFSEQDTATAPRVVIINQSMARYYFGDRNAVGRMVTFLDGDGPTEVVGVVKDYVKWDPHGDLTAEFTTYFPYRDKEAINVAAQSRLRSMMIAVRTAGDPLASAELVRKELRSIDDSISILRINTIEDQLSDVLVPDRLMAALSTAFSVLAVLLACLGLYGVISYMVARRTSEIGIRMALGAAPTDMLKMILNESLAIVLAGIAIGVPASLAASRLITSRLFGVGAADPATLVGATLLMMVVAAAAGLLPARRASRVDPLIALRGD